MIDRQKRTLQKRHALERRLRESHRKTSSGSYRAQGIQIDVTLHFGGKISDSNSTRRRVRPLQMYNQLTFLSYRHRNLCPGVAIVRHLQR